MKISGSSQAYSESRPEPERPLFAQDEPIDALQQASTQAELNQTFERRRSSLGPLSTLAFAREAMSLGDETLAIKAYLQATRAAFEVRDPSLLHRVGFSSATELGELMRVLRSRHAHQVRACFEELVATHGPKPLFRIERAVAGYLGEIPVVSPFPSQKAKWMFVPGLTRGGYLNPADQPICTELIRHFADIRDEYLAVMSASDDRLEAFMGGARGVLEGYVGGTDPRASWDAFFFYRHGRRHDVNHALCPHTSRVLDGADLCRIDGQAPEICFSVMQPGTVIEKHHGVTNARVVVHLPLVVPKTGSCFLDVAGCGQHQWKAGEPMVFDDTFEHGATNATDETRGILLMDAWHPGLSVVEREAFTRIIGYLTQVGVARTS